MRLSSKSMINLRVVGDCQQEKSLRELFVRNVLPKINKEFFPDTPAEPFWTSQRNWWSPNFWSVNFFTGHTFGRFVPENNFCKIFKRALIYFFLICSYILKKIRETNKKIAFTAFHGVTKEKKLKSSENSIDVIIINTTATIKYLMKRQILQFFIYKFKIIQLILFLLLNSHNFFAVSKEFNGKIILECSSMFIISK